MMLSSGRASSSPGDPGHQSVVLNAIEKRIEIKINAPRRVIRRVDGKQVLKLMSRYLEAGVMDGGLVRVSEEGTPQGSPLSPLLSNVMLDDLDWEVDRRGHQFVRHADDGRIYVSSERAGQRVMSMRCGVRLRVWAMGLAYCPGATLAFEHSGPPPGPLVGPSSRVTCTVAEPVRPGCCSAQGVRSSWWW
jgi:Reverse transcriptase (RNA-dependent DNA polymerase)